MVMIADDHQEEGKKESNAGEKKKVVSVGKKAKKLIKVLRKKIVSLITNNKNTKLKSPPHKMKYL